MQAFKITNILYCFILLSSCTRESQITADITIENVVYGLEDVPLYTSSVDKNKQKTNTQYLSTIYSDLYQTSIPVNDVAELSKLLLASGDKIMMSELITNAFIHDGHVQSLVPTQVEMNADIDAFIRSTYIRFYLREPTEFEKYYLKKIIDEDTGITPEIIYTAFATSNEYWFY
tara:strand:- start:55 stop:576 length:522 start_codon:yes stop_codon:yes gene_type:complete